MTTSPFQSTTPLLDKVLAYCIIIFYLAEMVMIMLGSLSLQGWIFQTQILLASGALGLFLVDPSARKRIPWKDWRRLAIFTLFVITVILGATGLHTKGLSEEARATATGFNAFEQDLNLWMFLAPPIIIFLGAYLFFDTHKKKSGTYLALKPEGLTHGRRSMG